MEQNELLEKMAPYDVDAGIYIVANSFAEFFSNPVKQEEPIAGGLVYRSEGGFTPERGWREGYTYVFWAGIGDLNRTAAMVRWKQPSIKGFPT